MPTRHSAVRQSLHSVCGCVHVCLNQIQSAKCIPERKCKIKEATKLESLKESSLAFFYLCLPVEEVAPRASFYGQITHASNSN